MSTPAPAAAEAKTKTGVIRGVAGERVHAFLGIRYAKPPTGPHRFLPPQPLAPGEQTTDATAYGNRNLQLGVLDVLVEDMPLPGEESEDCLFLNVHTPSHMSGDMPVLVWIHGGAFTSGAGADYDPTQLVEDNDVVVVTINYRLNIFGFLNLSRLGPEYAGSANLGTQDQIAALRWVSQNIEAFGGDPSNVTVWGQSAGATSVSSVLTAPSAEGLAHRAMVLSGAEVMNPPGDPTPAIKAVTGTTTDEEMLARLREMSPQELIELQTKAMLPVGPTLDGTILKERTIVAIQNGWARTVPVIAGTVIDDGTLLAAPYAADEKVAELYLVGLAADIGNGDANAYLQHIGTVAADESMEQKLTRAWYDFFRSSALRIAAAATNHGAGGWVYSFEVETDHPLGVTHFSDVPFIFKWIDADNPGLFVHPATPANRAISDRWSSVLVEFARSGVPGGAGVPTWTKFDAENHSSLRVSDTFELVKDADAQMLRIYGVE